MFSVIIFTLFRALAEKILNIHHGKPRTGGRFIVLAHLCQSVAPGVNKEQILFYSLPAPERHRTEVLTALQLPLLYSCLPPRFFCSLPGISGRGNGFLAATSFF